jgi:hypothetical protein
MPMPCHETLAAVETPPPHSPVLDIVYVSALRYTFFRGTCVISLAHSRRSILTLLSEMETEL